MSELMSLNIDDVLDQFKPGESQTLKSLARNTGLDCFTVRMVLRRLLHCRVVDIDYVGETRSRRVYHLTEIAKHPPFADSTRRRSTTPSMGSSGPAVVSSAFKRTPRRNLRQFIFKRLRYNAPCSGRGSELRIVSLVDPRGAHRLPSVLLVSVLLANMTHGSTTHGCQKIPFRNRVPS